ncbi:hypothetical protein VMCG_07758 [Cytospora schulzeri]|uniref:DNL-type domain-containing protein n=1 Tax=Cytospora schulzeri TaxID=448051 RepID=A0A423VZQ5_9PEZI|nr:hypothetical protein VMCG_07758 [Valsa malicola]
MASKGISPAMRALARISKATSVPTRPVSSQAQPQALRQALFLSTKTPAQRTIIPRPSYELTFTCVPCGTRSAHNISKQGYHHGSVLIACPSCRNRHVISDHLGIFGNRKITVEDLMREKGMLVKRGTLGEDGDIEFWEDGSTTKKSERQGDDEGLDPKPKVKSQPAAEAGEDDAPGSTFGKS